MKVTECLNTEHGVFLSQLRVLEKMLAEHTPAEELRAATLPIAETVERHRQAEEKIFYPAILKTCAQDAPPIEAMEAEHREVERCIEAIAARRGDTAELVRKFIDVLRRHLTHEIQVLFPMAEKNIPENELQQMTRECIDYYHHAAGVKTNRD